MSEPGRPAATVVIPTRDRLALLREAVASVVNQDWPDWELVVVDDASVDGTSEWLSSLPDPRIRYLRTTTSGERSAARNLGLADSRADYVLFLDDDDRLDRRALGRLVRALGRRPEAFAAVGARVAFDAGGRRHRYAFPRWPVVRPAWREVLAGWVATPGQMLLRTELIRRSGGWSEAVIPAEDLELWLRFAGCPACFVPAAVLEYRIHGVSRAPADLEQIEDGVRAEFLAGAEGRRATAERMVEARQAIRRSNLDFARSDPGAAARNLVGAFRLAPSLVWSPLLGPSLLSSLSKAIVAAMLPGPTRILAQRALRGVRERQGRAGLPS